MDDVRAYIRDRGPRGLRLIKYKMLGTSISAEAKLKLAPECRVCRVGNKPVIYSLLYFGET